MLKVTFSWVTTTNLKISRQPITLSCEKKDLKKKKHFLGCAMTANLSRYDIQCSVRSCMMLFSWGAKISSLPWNPHKPFCVLF